MDHAVGVVALGQGQIIHVSVEVGVASQTAVLRVADVDVARSPRDRIAQIMQLAHHRAETIGAPAAVRTEPTPVVATPLDDLGLRQILSTRDPFRHIADVPSRPSHGDILHESSLKEVVGQEGLRSAEMLCIDATVSTFLHFRG